MDKWTHRDRKLEKRSLDKDYRKPYKKHSKSVKENYREAIKTKYS
jgi:hypothetical protein